jgi:hypothetical protein
MTTQEAIVPHLDLGLRAIETAAAYRNDAGERIGPDPATFGG